MNRFIRPRAYADPEAAARKIMEIANGLGDVWDGRLFVEKLNWAMLHDFGASPAEWRAGIDRAVESGCYGRMRAARITASPRQAKTCLLDPDRAPQPPRRASSVIRNDRPASRVV
jgi:hypothetical protein